MEDLLCFGCSQYESKYREGNTIKICKKFAKKIWKVDNDDDLNKPSTRFDGCGLLAEDNGFGDLDEDKVGYIIPSKKFNNFVDFIEALGIPYYEDYTVTLVDGDQTICFDKSYYLKIYPIGIIIFCMISILNFYNLIKI